MAEAEVKYDLLVATIVEMATNGRLSPAKIAQLSQSLGDLRKAGRHLHIVR